MIAPGILAALAALAACVSTKDTVRGTHPSILVRRGPDAGADDSCVLAGDADAALYEPVAAFAREQLIDPWFQAPPNDPARAFLVAPGTRRPPVLKGLAIEIAPRSQRGHLSVGYYTGESLGVTYRGADYCLVVDHVGATTTVTVLKLGFRWDNTMMTRADAQRRLRADFVAIASSPGDRRACLPT